MHAVHHLFFDIMKEAKNGGELSLNKAKKGEPLWSCIEKFNQDAILIKNVYDKMKKYF